jgi:hypothetical protein
VNREPRVFVAGMRIQISDPTLQRDLVRYLRSLEYLAVEEGDGMTVVPIKVLSERAAGCSARERSRAVDVPASRIELRFLREGAGE